MLSIIFFVAYMAPEVVLKQDMGPPMDIWSVACVVVEMFTSKVYMYNYTDISIICICVLLLHV